MGVHSPCQGSIPVADQKDRGVWERDWAMIYPRGLAPVVQTMDSAIHLINPYLADKYYGNQLCYPLDSELYAFKCNFKKLTTKSA